MFLCYVLSIWAVSTSPGVAQTVVSPAGRITVGSVEEFGQALAGGGQAGTIALKPGIYDELAIRSASAEPAIGIVAADPSNRPIVRRLTISGSRNVTLEGLRFLGVGRETAETFLAEIRQSQNIRILKSEFGAPQGPMANATSAIRAIDVTTLQIADNVIDDLRRGVVLDRARGAVIAHNLFLRLDIDGVAIAQSDGVTLDSNRFDAFRPETVGSRHFVQMSTRQTSTPSQNIQITRNVMLQSEGEGISGVFLGNEDKRPYENIEVSKNIIVSGSPHGITLDLANNSSITDNMVLSAVQSVYKSAIRLQNARNSEVSRNLAVAYGYSGSQGIVSRRNVTMPTQNNLTRRRALDRTLEGLKQSSGAYPVQAGHAVLPEHRAAGPRPSS